MSVDAIEMWEGLHGLFQWRSDCGHARQVKEKWCRIILTASE
jgi:hypothetical protein